MCRHEIGDLIGTADGIICRKCGKKFTTFAEIHENAEAPAKAKAKAEAEAAPKTTRTRKKKEE